MIVGYCAAVQPSAAQARFRPSLDALFQSAAHHHGPRSIGVILSGTLNDGTVGLGSIASAGGTTIVQSDAAFDSMPRNALAATRVDHVVPSSQLSALLDRLTSRARVGAAMPPGQPLELVMREIASAMQASARHCAASGESSSSDLDVADLTPETALLRAEERITCLQEFARRADARASDRAGALECLRALESCSGRLRWLMSRQRVWSV
jgi:two-component system chemotaxis response regulator CheB